MWKEKGVLPADLFGRVTPRQFAVLFTKRADVHLDRLDELRKHNDERGRRGLKPAVPAWLFEPAR